MKHCFLLLSIFLLPIIGICQPNQQKASELVKQHITKVLDNPSGYESVSIEVNPLYNIPITNKDCIDAAKLVEVEEQLVSEYSQKASSAEETMNKYMLDLSDSGMKKYDDAAKVFYSNKISAIKASIRSLEQRKFIKQQASILNGKKQIGWEIVHSCKVKENQGEPNLLSFTFFSDMEYKNITAVFDNTDKKDRKAVLTVDTIAGDSETLQGYDNQIKELNNSIKSYQDLLSQLQ